MLRAKWHVLRFDEGEILCRHQMLSQWKVESHFNSFLFASIYHPAARDNWFYAINQISKLKLTHTCDTLRMTHFQSNEIIESHCGNPSHSMVFVQQILNTTFNRFDCIKSKSNRTQTETHRNTLSRLHLNRMAYVTLLTIISNFRFEHIPHTCQSDLNKLWRRFAHIKIE